MMLFCRLWNIKVESVRVRPGLSTNDYEQPHIGVGVSVFYVSPDGDEGQLERFPHGR